MRRCLRAFLVGLIALSLLGGPAHACWRTRQARHCQPVVVVACPAPGWNECCDPCGGTEVVVEAYDPPVSACCGAGGLVVDGSLVGEGLMVADGIVGAEAMDVVVETVIDTTIGPPPVAESQPTPAPGARTPVVAEPPALAPAGEASGVQTTSIEEPLSMPATSTPSAESPPAAPAPESVLADEVEMQEPSPEEAGASPAVPVEQGSPPVPLAPAPETVAPAPEEPELATEEPPPSAGPEPAGEPAPAEPEPVEPEPAMEPEPEPEAGNIFEELDAAGGEEAPTGEAGEMTDEPAADASEEPDADPFGDNDGDAAEPEMTDEEPAAAPDDDGGQPADPFARGEPARRWIDATGTASMVATLIEVGADGRCVLETRGHRIAVPLENLSGHDRDYVRQAGLRLAKLRAVRAGETAAAAPAPTDTAGL